MARVAMFLFFASLVLAIISLISCFSAEDGEVRALPRWAWVIIILFLPLVGSIAYLVSGRPATAAARPGAWRPNRGSPEAARPKRALAPDDDPDFLKQIDGKTAREDQELLRQWEADLKKREEDLRKQDKSKNEPPTNDG
jgi:hypothetical protein